MLILPPVSPGSRTERRSRTRRAADRAAAAASAEAPSAAPFSPERPESEVRKPRRDDRRAADRPCEREGAPAAYAPLVAQVIAHALGLEQTRVRRRGSPADAEALYRARRERPKRPRGEA